MISEYIEIIESFKKNQISKLIETISVTIFEKLNSPKFNRRIAEFFNDFNQKGEPFTLALNLDDPKKIDPDNISQIKKIFNALYHARLAFLDLENVDIRTLNRTASDLKLLYSKTIHEAYQASYLLTHLDVDIKDMFSEEFALILPLITKFQTIAANFHISANTKYFVEKLKALPISYKTGEITGIAIEQMQPQSGDLDYSLLTQFSADLPGYINKITQSISQFSIQLKEKAPNLNKEQIDELKNTALNLLNDLERLKGNHLFLSLKVLKYIHVMRDIITLSMSSLEQVGKLNESSQDIIRYNLTKLKYTVLPTLFGLIDKIEDNTMLKPGTLSIPVMKEIKPYYETLIEYTSKLVNFQEKGEELLSIEDSRFRSLRLDLTYKRIDTAEKSKLKIKKVDEAVKDFYLLLDSECKNLAIHQLPQKTKEELKSYYKIIKPYMMQIDVHFNELLIKSLQEPERQPSYLTKQWRWFRKTLPADHISFVLAYKETLKALLTKKTKTEEFHIDLNKDLIESVQEQPNLVLFPYNEQTNIFIIDESAAFNSASVLSSLQFKQEKEHNLLLDPKLLTADQALDLHQWYKSKHTKFMDARTAYDDFIKELKQNTATNDDVLDIQNLKDELRTKCRNLYNRFQPYFISGIPREYRTIALNFDSYIAHTLSNKKHSSTIPTVNLFAKMNDHFQNYFSLIDLNWNKRSRSYLRRWREKFKSENEASTLILDSHDANRANHLIPHTRYSKFINEFRKALYQVTAILNHSMNAELRAKSNGIPFPELEHKYPIQAQNQTLEQSKQTLAIKRIFNGLYHIEGIVHELEQLTNRQSESIYVYHLLQAYGHINTILTLTQGLANDPHFGLIGRELLEKAQTLFAAIQEHSDAYQASPDDVLKDGYETVEYNALWYSLNAFFIFPKHVRALSNNNYLTTAELDELHIGAKKSALRIEAIIKNSHSYFKLFLQSPDIYRLYRDLKNKLNEFISTSHDTVMDNLDKFRAQIFTPMLLAANRWEDKLGLKPGTISDTLKKITDEYYKGLLHPLGLDSKTHIALVCDKEKEQEINITNQKRINATNQKIDSATKYLARLEKNYKHVEELHKLITTHIDLTDSFIPASATLFNVTQHRGTLIRQSENTLIEAYPKALAKLVKLQKIFPPQTSTNQEETKFDRLLNSGIRKYEPKLSQIKALIITSHHYYLGLKATTQMQLNTAKEKLGYLNEVNLAQKKSDSLFIKEYTTESFDKQMETLCNRHIGLQYTDKEYSKKLKEDLLKFKEQIINDSQSAEDINLTVRTLLKEKISLFEVKHFAQYHHLDTVRIALAQFKNYFSLSNSAIEKKPSFFENEQTLEKKSGYVNRFIEIAENEDLSIEDRLSQIKLSVKNPNFERIIAAHKQEDYFSFTYLVQCFFALLEALYLYTPTRKKLYNSFSDAVNNQPQINELTNRFGLFAVTSPTPAPEIPSIDASVTPAPSIT